MRLKEIMKRLLEETNEEPDNEELKHILVEVPEELLQSRFLSLESQWKPSGYKDYMMRVDAENPSIPHQRHVHIARKKHTSSKHKQVSWNKDGSRHDKGSFDEKAATKAVRDIARKALQLDATVTLESINSRNDKSFVFEEEIIDIVDDTVSVKISIV